MFFLPMPLFILEILVFTTWVHFYNFWDVFLAYLAPCFLGAVLFSLAGRSIMMSLQTSFTPGQLPGNKVLNKAALMVGSILLLVPLFFTRVLAVFLIVPGLQQLSVFIFKTFIFQRLGKGSMPFFVFKGGGGGFQAGGFRGGGGHPFFEDEPRHEREAEVVNVTPLEITHTKIEKRDEE